MGLVVVGLALLAVGAAGAAVNLWARGAFPDQWGGPNIGAGLLQLVFYAGALGGAAMAVMGVVRWRRDRRS